MDIYLFQCRFLCLFHTCSSPEAYCEVCRQCKGGTCLWLWSITKTMNTQSVPSYCIISCLSPGASFMLCSCCCRFSRYPAFQNMLDFCLQEPIFSQRMWMQFRAPPELEVSDCKWTCLRSLTLFPLTCSYCFSFSRYQLGAMEKCQTRVVIQRYILSAVCRIFSHGYLF